MNKTIFDTKLHSWLEKEKQALELINYASNTICKTHSKSKEVNLFLNII